MGDGRIPDPVLTLDVEAVRARFPALGKETVFFDGPAGTQVPRHCIDAVSDYFVRSTSNSTQGAPFSPTPQAERTNALVGEAHAATADLLGGAADEIVLGPNMTTLALAMSRRIGAGLRPGDEILLSPLDHDANIAPWLLVAAERGLEVRWIEPTLPDCTLDPDRVAAALTPRTRVVSIGMASNTVGTLVSPAAIGRIGELARRHGALLWVDAVHSAPHVPIDVATLGADLLLCSTYKAYGPHLGACWARGDVLAALPDHNVRWRDGKAPKRFETGSLAFELLAGWLGTIDYLRWVGRTFGAPAASRRSQLTAALGAIRAYEGALCEHLLRGLQDRGAAIRGIADPSRAAERCPTVGFTLGTEAPEAVADRCTRRGFAVWSGEFASFGLAEKLRFGPGGIVRVGLAHYNTRAEIDRLLDVLGSPSTV